MKIVYERGGRQVCTELTLPKLLPIPTPLYPSWGRVNARTRLHKFENDLLWHFRFQYANACARIYGVWRSRHTFQERRGSFGTPKKDVFDDADSAPWNQRRPRNLLEQFTTAVLPLSNRWRKYTLIYIFRVFSVPQEVYASNLGYIQYRDLLLTWREKFELSNSLLPYSYSRGTVSHFYKDRKVSTHVLRFQRKNIQKHLHVPTQIEASYYQRYQESITGVIIFLVRVVLPMNMWHFTYVWLGVLDIIRIVVGSIFVQLERIPRLL